MEFAKAGIPISFHGMPQAGATGPVTLVGTIVINNAEVLSGLVITQLARAHERVKTILEKHRAEPLEKDVQREIRGIIKKAGKDLASI